MCPFCKEGIRVNRGEDLQTVWSRHERFECRGKPKKKKRCAAPGCKTVLGPSNTVKCGRCGQETCLQHRDYDDHPCIPEPKKYTNEKQSKFKWLKVF